MSESRTTVRDEVFDITARKVHQWGIILLSALAFLIDGVTGGWIMVGTGVLMVAGRFWDEVDFIRLFYHTVLKPAGILRPNMMTEDRATRRVARVLGGAIQIIAGVILIAGGPSAVAWGLVGAIAVMIALDATVSFCVLCFVVHQFRRTTAAAA